MRPIDAGRPIDGSRPIDAGRIGVVGDSGGAPAPDSPVSPTDTAAWRLGAAATTTSYAGFALTALGLVLARPDVAVIGAALLVGLLWDAAAARAPTRLIRRELPRHLGEEGRIRETLGAAPAPGGGLLRLRVSADGYRDGAALAAVPAAGRTLQVRVDTARTGLHRVFRVDWLAASPAAALQTPARTSGERAILVLPGARMLHELPLPFRLQGLTGAHSGRRPGEGGDLRDVSLFAPGDRLRRIDWRVTARRSGEHGGAVRDLYVRRDFAMADAVVMLVVDSRDEIGPDIETWSGSLAQRPDEASSLDLAREAAASLARHYLRGGDRVGLDDLGQLSRPVAPAGGAAQLRRLTHRLAVLAPEGAPRPHRRAPQVPSGSLIALFSTFLDSDAATLARLWRRAGHRVIAVDVLPDPLRVQLPAALSTAHRIVMMERADRVDDLARAGIEVVRWPAAVPGRQPGADAAVALSALARTRGARR
ncbi:MAG: DUF58 domain-containing protein [Frankiaceae bacterium]|jgi:uncharacterized protein (DUF58 family)|nr:DUF58 domain-containing protein [Frankiaceae bacterium]